MCKFGSYEFKIVIDNLKLIKVIDRQKVHVFASQYTS